MFADIVFPDNNEDEFIDMALRLGYKGLCFVYNFDVHRAEKYKELIAAKQKETKIKLHLGFLADFNKIRKAKKSNALVFAADSEKNREILEKSPADVLFGLEAHTKRDFIHHRASGLNHILCRLAAKNEKMIGFSFSSVLNSSNKEQVLGRISQNIALCRKFKVKTLVGSFASDPYEMRSPNDLISLFEVLGMHVSEAKKSLIIFQ